MCELWDGIAVQLAEQRPESVNGKVCQRPSLIFFHQINLIRWPQSDDQSKAAIQYAELRQRHSIGAIVLGAPKKQSLILYLRCAIVEIDSS